MSSRSQSIEKKEAAEKIIVALDVAEEEDACGLVKDLCPPLSFFKVGMRLYAACGPRIITKLKNLGVKVFLDLKFHDIPHTVASAVEIITSYGVDMFNIHLSGGSDMIRAAVEKTAEVAAKLGIPKPAMLGVTVLTSLPEKVLREELAVERSLEQHVLDLSLLGKKNGIDGVVASPREAGLIRQNCGKDFLIVSPGVRPGWSTTNDQARVLTPRQALEGGADYLVIGRPITGHTNPGEAVEKILAEIVTVQGISK
ncbi:MAG: orotidine-5'-phosphate decarboxylase [Firmicutes bacterium]|nr:orotidine-5'-phosphate decarboxylase [Bacillota bacterium]